MKHIKIQQILVLTFCICSVLLTANAGEPASRFKDWQMMGPTGGDVRAITIDPKDSQRIFISTLDGQVYKSENGGNNWTLLGNFNSSQLILDQLMIDSRDSNIIYTSGHRHTAAGGFFKTTDGGKN